MNKLGLSCAKLNLSCPFKWKMKSKPGVETVLKVAVQLLLRFGGWLENWIVILILTQTLVEVKVGVELGLI